MATEGDRQSVFRTTKVRAALKGDSSWIQLRNQAGVEEDEEEKPWIAEVRAGRVNSDLSDPVADNTPPEREPPPSSNTDSSKTSGYMIRGVFTKTDTKPSASSTNGYIGTSGFTKKSSEGYKKIAPHTIRSSAEKTEQSESSLVTEEQDRRTEAASKVLNSSAGKQRSYVLSAAKKYDLSPGTDSPATAFVAKRVVLCDDEDNGSLSVEMSVDEPIPPASSPAKTELKPTGNPKPTPKQSDTVGALSDTLLSTPKSPSKKPVVQVTSPVPETKKVSKPEPVLKTSLNETITQATSVAPVATLKKSATTEPKPDSTPKASAAQPVAPAVPAVKEVPSATPEPKPKPKPEATPNPSSNPRSAEKTSALSDNDLLGLSESKPQNLVDPIPPTTDLLTGDSLPKTPKTKGSLDLLAIDVIPIDTNTDKLSSDKTSTKIEITQSVVKTKKDVKSTSKNLVDPVPTTTDLLTGGSLLSETQKTSKPVDLLAYDTNMSILRTEKTQRTVETTKTVTKTVEKSSLEHFDPLLSDSYNGQQQTVAVSFEQKSSKNTSPWDKWTVPTIDAATSDSEPEPDPEPEPSNNSYTTYTWTEETTVQEPEPETKKNLVYVKSYVKSSDLPSYSTSRYNDYDYVTSSSSSYAYSSPPSTVAMTACTYCGSLVGNDAKITIDHLNISCHPECFKCGICSKPMGDFIHSMFLHRGMVHCENCYSNVI